MARRAYVSPLRAAAAAEKRDRVIEAAAKSLREGVSCLSCGLVDA